MFTILKKALPHSLFRRFLLIILLPNIIIQLVAVYVFYERHWSGVSRQMAHSLAGEIALIAHGAEQLHGKEKENLLNITKNSFDLDINITHNSLIRVEGAESGWRFFRGLRSELHYRLAPLQYSLSFLPAEQLIVIEVQIDNDVVTIKAPKRSIFTPTTYIFILWMIGTAIIFVIIAILFMRNQVRSITKLAEVAESFGRGKDIPNFRPSGATEVRQVSQAFIDMKERIKRQVEQRTEMLAGVSHDLKTPLTRMKLQLAMLDQSEEIKDLREDIIQMEKMVHEYIDFAKGKERVVDANVNIADMLRSIASGYRNLKKPIDLKTQNGVTLHINANSLRRAVTNIVDNALKYGNSLRLTSSASDKYAYIIIDDDGPGIAEGKRAQVFQPFFRLDTGRNRDKGGTGLGLAIARDIVVSYGGEISLETSPIGGLRAIIKLPI